MSTVNKAIIVGNLGEDPKVHQTQSGSTITKISVATTEKWKDKSGEKQERTEWHRVTFFNKLGEIAAQYLSKGTKVYIEGSIRTDKYQDKNTGEDRYSTGIVGNTMQILSSRNESSQQSGIAPHNQTQSPPPANFDDDIPF